MMLHFLRRMRRQGSAQERFIIFGLIFTAVYLVFGSVAFMFLESEEDGIIREELRKNVTDFVSKYNIADEDIKQLFDNIRDAARNGIWMEGTKTNGPSWTFGQAFFFSGTLISTVGYGRISPRTDKGKLFTIAYCLFGIPLTLALLSALVAKLRRPSHWVRAKLNLKLGERFPAGQIQLLHLGVISIFMLVFMFLIPSWIFMQIEKDWQFLDAVYYCFVSLTTIGLGDYEPGDHPDQQYSGFYKMICTAYLLLGLTAMMLFLATLYDIPQLNVSRFFLTDQAGEDEEDPIVEKNSRGPKYARQDDDAEGAAYNSSQDIYNTTRYG